MVGCLLRRFVLDNGGCRAAPNNARFLDADGGSTRTQDLARASEPAISALRNTPSSNRYQLSTRNVAQHDPWQLVCERYSSEAGEAGSFRATPIGVPEPRSPRQRQANLPV